MLILIMSKTILISSFNINLILFFICSDVAPGEKEFDTPVLDVLIEVNHFT